MNIRIRKWTAALFALLLLLSSGCSKAEEEDKGPTIGYAVEGVTVLDDGNSLARAIQELEEESRGKIINLDYKPDAYSIDGVNFTCYLGNSLDNPYDMYIQIVGAGQDQLYLSGLIRPGQAFERITLDHALKPGRHAVDCTFSLVDTAEDGTQTLVNQVTMEIYLTVQIP